MKVRSDLAHAGEYRLQIYDALLIFSVFKPQKLLVFCYGQENARRHMNITPIFFNNTYSGCNLNSTAYLSYLVLVQPRPYLDRSDQGPSASDRTV